jgi:hypothetical protein
LKLIVSGVKMRVTVKETACEKCPYLQPLQRK